MIYLFIILFIYILSFLYINYRSKKEGEHSFYSMFLDLSEDVSIFPILIIIVALPLFALWAFVEKDK